MESQSKTLLFKKGEDMCKILKILKKGNTGYKKIYTKKEMKKSL